jgi:ABC-2 type transport system permease protein
MGRGFRQRFSRLAGEEGSGGASASRWLRGRHGPRLSVMIKDLLLFLRDPVQYSQLALLAGLFLIYTVNIRRFEFDVGDPVWRGVAVFLNISFSGFVMATLLVRFAFPSVSLEKPGLHAVLTCPGGRRVLYWSKWIPAFVLLLVVLEATGYFSAVSIGAGPVLVLETVISIALLSVVLVSINVGMGAIFPEFTDNNAARIASGHGGITSAFVSMGFVLLVVSLLSIVTRTYMVEGFTERSLVRPLSWTFAVLIPLSLFLSWLLNRLAVRSLARRDF